jgi:ferric-dicitrate binding protein FerR (iron transport regulator)
VSGKVAVSGRLGHVLTAGMVGRFSDTSDVVTAQAPDVAWTRGALVFRDTPLPEALATLSRWYGIELRMADSSMASWHVNGTFAGDSRSEALTTLRSALSVNLTYLGAPGQVPVVTLVQRKRTTDRDGNDRRKLKHFTDTSREVGR